VNERAIISEDHLGTFCTQGTLSLCCQAGVFSCVLTMADEPAASLDITLPSAVFEAESVLYTSLTTCSTSLSRISSVVFSFSSPLHETKRTGRCSTCPTPRT
jgi:hypothetical protein